MVKVATTECGYNELLEKLFDTLETCDERHADVVHDLVQNVLLATESVFSFPIVGRAQKQVCFILVVIDFLFCCCGFCFVCLSFISVISNTHT